MKQAFVIPRTILVDHGFMPLATTGKATYHTFTSLAEFNRLAALAQAYGSFRTRGGPHDVEHDQSVQQLIVYGYVRLSDGRFMLYQRGSRPGSEQRLASKVSLGIGGHMEPHDASLMDAFYRELAEEVAIEQNGHPLSFTGDSRTTDVALIQQYIDVRPVGLIKDERDDVGKVHLGIACCLTPKQPGLTVRIRAETDENIRSFFVTPREYRQLVKDRAIEPEGWTEIVFRNELALHNRRK